MELGAGGAGDGGMPHTDIDIDLQDVKKECLDYAMGVRQIHGSIKIETVTIKAEPGIREEDRGTLERPYTEIDIALPDIKMECLEHSEGIKQAADLATDLKMRSAENRFSCSHCNYSCSSKSALERHDRAHFEVKSFARSDFLDSSSKNANLRKRFLIYTDDKHLSCSVCSYSCSQKGTLKRHMLTHSGEKPFSCSECRKSFSQKAHLKSHMLIHNGEKPFSCFDCKKSFSLTAHLKRHMLTHSGVKPF